MQWKKFKIKTVTEAEDIIISALYDIGLEGAQIEDKIPLTAREKEQMFIDILPESHEDDGVAYLSFFLEMAEGGNGIRLQGSITDTAAVLQKVYEELGKIRLFMDIGQGIVTVEETEDADWINNWKEHFHSFSIDDLLVVPSWEEVRQEDMGRMVLRIDPGTAFGTGLHETTQLCIRRLRQYVTPETELLDVGTGSGILSIVALLCGARHCFLTDLDICAAEAVEQNCRNNGISDDRYAMVIGNIIRDCEIQGQAGYERYDVVVANILAEVLMELTPVIVRHLKKGGVYITSGIIDGKEACVTEAVSRAGLTILGVDYQGEWASVTAKKD